MWIFSHLTPLGMPQWNGVSERRNRTMVDMVKSMMSQTDLLLSFWGYALEIIAFTLNRVPTCSIERTSYEIWMDTSQIVSHPKIPNFEM
jgi:hypothetical protein